MNPKVGRYPTHPKNVRADAAWVLFQVLEHGRSCQELMPLIFERHETQQRAWLQEMIFGCLRDIPRLQLWLRQLLDKPLKGEQKPIEHLIMLGFYQLSFARTSDHAAVSETVNAVELLGSHRLKGLVNAILRNFQRQETKDQEIKQPHVQSGLPKWLYKQLLATYPEQFESIVEQTNQRPPLWLRVNQLVSSVSDYATALKNENIEHEIDNATNAILLKQKVEVTQLPMFQEGAFSVQDKAAQYAALLLDVQADEHVLDCCAAPGGKTAHLLESQPNLASLTAIDSESQRLDRVHENFARLGHDKRFEGRLSILCKDASLFGLNEDIPKFDKILLDAPCSASGVIRRHPDIRWLRKKDDIENLRALQQEILENIWTLLAPGGTLLYATCSILAQENKTQILSFLSRHPEARLKPINQFDTDDSPGWQILPGEAQMDGFYYARLVKSA